MALNISTLLTKKVSPLVLPFFRHSPDFLIIGAQKAGTTSLHAYLKEHPRIAASLGPKELHYFNLYHHKGLSWYLSKFPWRLQSRGKLTFEATPDYVCHAQVPARIRQSLGRPKLILTLREPSERAYSAWKMWHNFADHPSKAAKADLRSFPEAIRDELSSADGQSNLHFHYIAMGRYVEHIENFRQYFSESELLILDYQDMSSDLYGFLGQICEFLEIEHFSAEQCSQLGQARHWVGPPKTPCAEEEATLSKLRDYYAPYNERLFDLLGRRFAWQS